MARLFLVVLGLWVGISVVMLVMAHANNLPLDFPKILSESFYYAAIAFAVYHLLTRNKRPRPQPAEAAPPPEELSGIHAQEYSGDDQSADFESQSKIG